MYDLIIIGAGPAGLTAAIYALRSGKNVLVLESSSYGGQIIDSSDVENYPGYRHISGFELATNMYNQAVDLGATINYERVIKINNNPKNKEVLTEQGNTYQTKAIIIATGNKKRKLNLPDEDRLIGKGVSYCATCDGAFYKGKTVLVVGGGNTAIEDALYLSNLAQKVYLVHRRDNFRADDRTLELLKEKENVQILVNSNVTKIIGNDKLEGVEINNQEIINIEGLFIAVGQKPENDVFKDIINLDSNGYVLTDDKCHTNIKGIYAAGDTRKKELRQLVTATSDGAIAAGEVVKYLDNIE